MADIEQIQKFIKEKYQVTVDIFEEECVLKSPARKDLLITEVTSRYNIQQVPTHGHGVYIQRLNCQDQITKKAIYIMPIYALRTYIVCDIVKSCVVRGFPFSLTRFFHKDKDVERDSLFDILKPSFDIDEENIEKELLIREIFLRDDYNSEERLSLVNEGVEEGFRILCNFFLEI